MEESRRRIHQARGSWATASTAAEKQIGSTCTPPRLHPETRASTRARRPTRARRSCRGACGRVSAVDLEAELADDARPARRAVSRAAARMSMLVLYRVCYAPLVVVDERICTSVSSSGADARPLGRKRRECDNDKERAEQLQRAEPLVVQDGITRLHSLVWPKSFLWLQTRAMRRKARVLSSSCIRRR